jgi:hypothetical protein
VSSGGVCGLGRTSQAGAAVSPGECLECEPLVPDVMRWRDKTDQCEFECLQATDTRRGSRCVPERLGCDEEAGLARGADGVCAAQAYPWNRPGRRKTGGVVVVSARVPAGGAGVEEAPYPRASSVGFGIKNRHSVTAAPGAAAVPVQGPLCSSTTGVVRGHAYVFGAVCNQSFLVYLNLSQPAAGLRVLIGDGERGWRDGFKTQARFESELYVASGGDGTLFVLDTWNCVLREVVVWDRPGSYLTRAHTLWGDTGKLGLAEGAEAKCYGPGSLAWPRRFWPLLGAGIAGWLAFADEDGLWQFHTGTRELLEVAKEAAVAFEADELEQVALTDPFTLRLLFRGGYEMLLEAAQEPCPDGRTSLAGGVCTLECRWLDLSGRPARYVDAGTGACRACTRPACGEGEELALCTPRADGVCRRCALWKDPVCAAGPCPAGCTRCAFAGGNCTCTANATLVYSVDGTCDEAVLRPVPPCGAGWHLLAGGAGYCAPCPPFTATLFPGATRAEQCKCVEGMARRGGACVGEDLYEFEPSCLGSEACSVPRNALVRTDGGPTCGWVCKPGHYRDTSAGFLDQCRPCLGGSGRTRGDDDEPWSCE